MKKLFLLCWVVFSSAILSFADDKTAESLICCKISSSTGLTELSELLRPLQKSLAERYGASTVYLAGGGAVSVLDHIFLGAPLAVRDVDIFAVLERPVDKAAYQDAAQEIMRLSSSTYKLGRINSSQRCKPARKADNKASCFPTYSLVLFYGSDTELDIKLRSSRQDLQLEGIYSVDKIQIPLHYGQPLEKQIQAAFSGRSYSELLRAGTVVDEHGGYQDWLNKTAKVLNWGVIIGDPPNLAVRTIRLFVQKLGQQDLPPAIKARLVELLRETRSQAGIYRNLIKIFQDKQPALELKLCDEIGLIRPWSAPLHQEIQKRSIAELEELLQARADLPPTTRFQLLLNLLPAQERRRLATDDIMKTNKNFAQQILEERREPR